MGCASGTEITGIEREEMITKLRAALEARHTKKNLKLKSMTRLTYSAPINENES